MKDLFSQLFLRRSFYVQAGFSGREATIFPVRLAVISLVVWFAFQPESSAEILTWEDCAKETSARNPDLLAAHQQVVSAQAAYQSSFSGFLPQVSADAGYNRSGSDDSSGVRKAYSTGLSARQNLFAGGGDAGTVRRARAQLDIAESNFDAVAARVSFELRSAFAGLLFAQQQLDLTETIASRRRENVRLVQLRYEAGREHKGSYLRSKAAARQSTFEVSQAKRALRLAQRSLSRVMGLSPFDAVSVSGEFATSQPSEPADFRDLVPQMPEYRQAQAQLVAAEAGVVVARSDLFPSLTASGSLGRQGGGWPPDSDSWSTGLSLSYPFFPGGRNVANYRSAKADLRRNEANLKSIADSAALDLEDAFASFQNNSERTEVQSEFLEAARVRAEIARSQYTSGLLSFEDWDIIENDLINNQKTWLASRRDAVVSEAAWDRAQGKGLP